MKTLGIDIGTTTISAAVLEDGQFLASETRANGAFIPSALTCAREQDVEKITQIALSVIETLFERYPDIHSIGVTGQMHGILYVDADGNAVSPLYTWQDARGSLPHSKTESWVQYLTRETGCLAAVGFGLATHAYNLAAGLVPPAAVTCCTIGDNQASFLRSVRDKTAEMLVNVGTGSQFSVFTPHYLQADGLETRPMPGGGYLLAGASLCGGRAYALLEQFSAPPRPCSAQKRTAATTQWRVC